MTIFDGNFLMTIFDDIETIFDNWKDSPGDLTFETLITISTIETLKSDNHSYLTVNCDTGQHSQFLRCLISVLNQFRGIAVLMSHAALSEVLSFDPIAKLYSSVIWNIKESNMLLIQTYQLLGQRIRSDWCV